MVEEGEFSYLQTCKILIKKTFISNQTSEVELSAEKYLLLLKPIYCLEDLRDRFYQVKEALIKIDLVMILIVIDPSLEFRFGNDHLLESTTVMLMTHFGRKK